MLAMEYALTQPEGLASLILASSPSSIPQWVEETGRLRRELPADVQAVLDAHEAAGMTDDPAYVEACDVFYHRHVCRLPKWPQPVQLTFRFLEEHGEVYRYMNGPSEFHVVGTLTDWDVTGRLREVEVPALVVTGEFDEATPAINRTLSEALPRSESVIYPAASHMAHVEDTEGYCRLLEEFMSRVEAAG
jgi:proline-specific peptidase